MKPQFLLFVSLILTITIEGGLAQTQKPSSKRSLTQRRHQNWLWRTVVWKSSQLNLPSFQRRLATPERIAVAIMGVL